MVGDTQEMGSTLLFSCQICQFGVKRKGTALGQDLQGHRCEGTNPGRWLEGKGDVGPWRTQVPSQPCAGLGVAPPRRIKCCNCLKDTSPCPSSLKPWSPNPTPPSWWSPYPTPVQALASKPHIPRVEDPYPMSLKPMTPKPTSAGWGSPHPMPPSLGPVATGAWKWQQPLPSPMAPGSRLRPAPVSRPQTNQRSLGPSPRDYSPAGLAGQGWGWPDPGKPEDLQAEP